MRIGEWTVIILTMVLVLQLLGVTTGLGILGNFGINVIDGNATGGDLQNSSFWALALAILGGIGLGSAALIGFFTKSYDTSLVVAPFLLSVAAIFGSTFFSIMSMPGIEDVVWIHNIVFVIFSAMGVSFLWSAINYFRGVA